MNTSELEYNKATFFYSEIMNSFKMDFSLYEDLVEVIKPKSVLELGCGMGRLFPIFMKEAEVITGVDLSDKMIDNGRRYFDIHNYKRKNIEFICADICSFDANRKYDLIVVALSVLKHLATDMERIEVLQNARRHLNKNGFIVIDHTAFLYSTISTDWIDAEDSMVASWMPDPKVLNGYQWKKTILGDTDTLHWRYYASDKIEFEVTFTTYRYDIEKLIGYISELGMKYEQLLTEWGVNGLSNRGLRFIGLVNHPGIKFNQKQIFIDKINERNEKLWSNHAYYVENKCYHS